MVSVSLCYDRLAQVAMASEVHRGEVALYVGVVGMQPHRSISHVMSGLWCGFTPTMGRKRSY